MTWRIVMVPCLGAVVQFASAAGGWSASRAAATLSADTVTEVHYVMGTYFRVTAEQPDTRHARAALHRCFATTRQLEELFSRFIPDSELSRVNAATAPSPITVSPEMAALLQRAIELQSKTAGAFDASVGSLTALWRDTPDWPTPVSLALARQSVGSDALRVAGTTLFRRPGTIIDLDGIAKGWAVDRCVSQFRAWGIERAFFSFGESSLYGLGRPTGANGWMVEIRGLSDSQTLGTVTLRDQAMSVSSVFGHERQVGGTCVGHVIDPRNGQPLTSAAMAVVVAPSATDAEAFSKALLIVGDQVGAGGTAAHHTRQTITGALLIGPDGVQRSGRIAFAAYPAPQPITAAAEPLR